MHGNLGKTLVAAAVAWAALAGLAGPPAAAEPEPEPPAPAPTSLTLTAERGYADRPTDLVATLVTATDGAPVTDVSVELERRTGGAWTPFGTARTDEAGRAGWRAVLSRRPAHNVFRATWAGDATYAGSASEAVAVPLRRWDSEVVLTGPARVRDGRPAVLRVRWRTSEGEPVPGKVRLVRRVGPGAWRLATVLRTDAEGRAQWRVRTRSDTRWRARATGTPWAGRAWSDVLRIDHLPPGSPVRLPAGAPRPRVTLPPQPLATGKGPQLRISRIPDGVWASMVGRSWHRGCPVGRAGLRLVRVNYWDFDGYRRRGEVVAAASAAGRMGAALAAMHERRLPIRSMYRVDRFGWSSRLQGADDYRSMAADNTSAFNCRWVVGRPGIRSPHSYGRSLDVNPWENPYRASHGWTPNAWWVSRSHPRVAWRSGSHPVVALMRSHGLRWTYGRSDMHHFDAAYGAGRTAPRRLPPACDVEVCH
ncbi:M15 family metallopeptidase [Nocardioides sp. SYSU DS0663]|uniref:M15 family metallopeptidase n=1 Tax=Nocardioides sp. SYSU DS0663 TaxID=3416445 RepID=UPI003F4B91A3